MRLLKQSSKLLSLAACLVIFSAVTVSAKDFTELLVLVQNQQGEPIPRANVIIRRVKSKPGAAKVKVSDKQLSLRTSMQGTAPLPPLEQGLYMIQVISPGYRTYGRADLVLNEQEQSVTVTLEPPQEQVSVFK